MITDGIKSANQVQFQNEEGVPTVPVLGADGGLKVEIVAGGGGAGGAGGKTTTTLYAGVNPTGTSKQTLQVNKKVSKVSIANLGKDSDVTVSIDTTDYKITSGVAVDLPINKQVTEIGLQATKDNTTVQYVIEGEA